MEGDIAPLHSRPKVHRPKELLNLEPYSNLVNSWGQCYHKVGGLSLGDDRTLGKLGKEARSPVIVHSRKFSKDDIFVHVLLSVVLSLSVFPRLVIFVTMLKFKMDPFLASQQREPS